TALQVHQIYYAILIGDTQRSALQAKIKASEDLQGERVQQVKYGAALAADLLQSRADTLQSRQDLLTTELHLSDLRMQFNNLVGLPLSTAVALDPEVATLTHAPCALEECVTLAMNSQPEIAEARAAVGKAEAAVRLASYEYVPDVEAFATFSHQN